MLSLLTSVASLDAEYAEKTEKQNAKAIMGSCLLATSFQRWSLHPDLIEEMDLLQGSDEDPQSVNGTRSSADNVSNRSDVQNVSNKSDVQERRMPVWVFCMQKVENHTSACEESPQILSPDDGWRCFTTEKKCIRCQSTINSGNSKCASAIKTPQSKRSSNNHSASPEKSRIPEGLPKLPKMPAFPWSPRSPGSSEVHNESNASDAANTHPEDTHPEEGHEQGSATDAEQAFKDADLDASGFLEEKEVQKFMSKMDMQGFDWKSLDTDHDDKVSSQEFAAAIGESDEDGSDTSEVSQFAGADSDGSGFLEEEEMQKLLSQIGMQGFDWKIMDTDHDGKISESEFALVMGR